jgi:hypothetical protein
MSLLQQYRAFILIAMAVLALLVASPVLSEFLVAPQTEYLTELSLLGPYHNASYPFNVTSGDVYPYYLTVSNHLGSSAYYQIQVKFRNQTEPAPDSFNHAFSDLPSLCNITFFVADKSSFELPLNGSLHYQENPLLREVNLDGIMVNGYLLNASSTSVPWDSQKNAYLGNLFFELWLYNSTINDFQYHQRYVSLWLNMTQ